jgi:hypothetical protein
MTSLKTLAVERHLHETQAVLKVFVHSFVDLPFTALTRDRCDFFKGNRVKTRFMNLNPWFEDLAYTRQVLNASSHDLPGEVRLVSHGQDCSRSPGQDCLR